MTELDKFKRRLVRSVSRLLKQDVEEQQNSWKQLHKETGCDCKLLWERMRALTIKKMKRLLAADDRHESIAAVARLSATDWLLFNLVLVHDKLDVIGRDQINRPKGQLERPILEELFELVQEFEIEKKQGDTLLGAWTALTRFYNSRGRHVSPMLLQRRWYQLKEMTRANFYKLWNNYRGNQRLWDATHLSKPTPLQAEIAKKFPQVITQPFPDWEELIQTQKVVLPEQFEMLHRMKNHPKTGDDKPDLVVIEPVIETIELGDESDGENSKYYDDNAQLSEDHKVNLTLVKQEPIEDGLSNVQILETTHIPTELDEDTNSNSHLSSFSVDRENLEQQMSHLIQANTAEDAPAGTDQIATEDETPDVTIIEEPSDETLDVATVEEPSDETSNVATVEEPEVETLDFTELPDDFIKQKADEYIKSKLKKLLLTKPENKETSDLHDDDLVNNIIKQKADDFVRKVDLKKLVHDVVDEFKLPEELTSTNEGMTFTDEGIEFVDDGIEYVEDDDNDAKEEIVTEEEPPDLEIEAEAKKDKEDVTEEEKPKKEIALSPKFDLKLLMEPVVYTTKLDDMIIFKGKKFDFVEFQNVIDSVIVESKPVSKQAVKVEVEDDGDNDVHSKSNLSQVNDELVKNNDLGHSNDLVQNNDLGNDLIQSNDLGNDLIQSNHLVQNNGLHQNVSHFPNQENVNDFSNYSESDGSESDEQIDESLKVKSTSYLLQKPRNRSYNPINLCKNPDFNTRLKRLTAGFFSSARNRQLFSACKPMTIDVHKAFESKLVNGTLYIKSSGENLQPIREETENAQSSSVMPSAMPIQSLLSKDNTVINIDDLMSSTQTNTVDLTLRSKTINLRDLSEIRRINQNLLTAQVPPMRLDDIDEIGNAVPARHRLLEKVKIDDMEDQSDRLEPKVKCISGGQFFNNTTTVQDQDSEDEPIPDNYRGRGRGRGRGARGRGTAGVIRPLYFPMYDDMEDNLEPRVKCIGGGQDFNKTTTVQDQDSVDEPNSDKIPNNYRGTLFTEGIGRGHGARGRGASGVKKPPYSVPMYPVNRSSTIAPWRLGPKPKPTNIDDFLITIDTLNRMINKLDGTQEVRNSKKVKGNKLKNPVDSSTNTQHPILNTLLTTSVAMDTNTTALNTDITTDKKITTDITTHNELTTDNETHKDASTLTSESNVLIADDKVISTVPEAIIDVSVETSVEKPKTRSRNPNPKKKRNKYCCWAREKFLKVNKPNSRIYTIHRCPSVCQCCCRQALVETTNLWRKVVVDVGEPSNKESIVLSDGEYDADNDSNDVRIPGFDPEPEPPVPRVRVCSTPSKNDKHLPGKNCSHANSTCTSACAGGGAPMSVAGVSGVKLVPKPVDPQPVLRINVNFTDAPSNDVPTVQPVTSTVNAVTSLPESSLLQHIVSQISPIPPSAVPPLLPGTSSSRVTIPVTMQPTKNTFQRQIVIDASGPTTNIATEKIDERIMFLNSKTLARKPKESPIFLGKNKILLTTVKFPPNLNGENSVSDPPIQPSKVIPTLALPSGVQLLLLPDGQLTYTVDPSVQLDEAQLAVLPSIIAAVQQQISISSQQTAEKKVNLATESILLPTSEDGANKKDELNNVEQSGEKTVTEISQSNNAKNIQESLVVNQPNEINITEDTNKNNHTSKKSNAPETAPGTTDAKDNLNSSKYSEIITIEETDDPPSTNTTTATTSVNNDNDVNEGASGSRNLLSDLMEMSGISAEDSRPQETTTQQVAPVQPSIPVMNILEAPPVETAVGTSLLVSTTGSVPAISASDIVNLPELTSITSLIELKYACENNGSFFKFDLDTGIISPINVCIKKNLKPKNQLVLRRNNEPKTVIDLTDDVEKETSSNIAKDGTVKPIKLFKRIAFNPPNLLNKKRKIVQVLHNTQQLKSQTAHKRKQNLQKIEAKIDLVDSDAPMEEEYLVDSSGSDDDLPRKFVIHKTYAKKASNEIEIVTNSDSGDSSDEEPLSKKFMRLKQGAMSHAQANDENYDTNKNTNEIKANGSKDPTETQEVVRASVDLPVPIGPPKPVGLPTPVGSPAPIGPLVPIGPQIPTGPETLIGTPTPIGPPVPIGPPTPIGPLISTGPPVPTGSPTPIGPLTPIDLPTPVASLTPVAPLTAVPSESVALEAEKDSDTLNSDEMEIEDSQFFTFLSAENESQEEDCILGV